MACTAATASSSPGAAVSSVGTSAALGASVGSVSPSVGSVSASVGSVSSSVGSVSSSVGSVVESVSSLGLAAPTTSTAWVGSVGSSAQAGAGSIPTHSARARIRLMIRFFMVHSPFAIKFLTFPWGKVPAPAGG